MPPATRCLSTPAWWTRNTTGCSSTGMFPVAVTAATCSTGTCKEIGIGIASTSAPAIPRPAAAALVRRHHHAGHGLLGGIVRRQGFLTGVAYSDTGTVNDFYDPGEGLGNVTVTATPVGGGTANSTTTWASGGYSLPLAPGTYNVVFSGSGLARPVTYANVAIGATTSNSMPPAIWACGTPMATAAGPPAATGRACFPTGRARWPRLPARPRPHGRSA